MNDQIPLALLIGCLLATLGLIRVCEWLRPADQAQRAEQAGSRASMARREEDRP